eukprot:SAG25_NODE_8487_length_419_cov_0.959375_1_plen_74_part_10
MSDEIGCRKIYYDQAILSFMLLPKKDISASAPLIKQAQQSLLAAIEQYRRARFWWMWKDEPTSMNMSRKQRARA